MKPTKKIAALFVAVATILGFAAPTSAGPKPPVAVVVSAHPTPSSLPSTGGHVTVAGKVKNATSCQLKLLSHHSFPVLYSHNPKSCTSGGYSAHLVIEATPNPVRRNVTFALVASNKTSSSTVRFSVALLAAPTTTTTTTAPTTTTTVPTTTTTKTVVVVPPPPSLTNQTISFTSTAPSNATVGGTYTPTAAATSRLTVTITIDASASSVCSISSGLVTFNATGNCVIDANQAGGSGYNPAPQVQQIIAVTTTISVVANSYVDDDYTNGGTASGTTLAVDPQNDGDVLVVCVDSHYFAAGLTSLSGGGVTTWTKGEQFLSANSRDMEVWFGTVTATGPSTITFNWPVDITGDWTEYTAQEFSAPGAVWSLDNGNKSDNTSSSTTVTYPVLTPSGTAELYYGYAGMPNPPTPGSTSGFIWKTTQGGNLICYDTDVSGAVSPTATQGSPGVSEAAAVLLTA